MNYGEFIDFILDTDMRIPYYSRDILPEEVLRDIKYLYDSGRVDEDLLSYVQWNVTEVIALLSQYN